MDQSNINKLRLPVVAIPPSYDNNQNLEVTSTINYINYLESNGASYVMTTAGTSQFNLLSNEEVHTLNRAVSKFGGTKILGVPPLSTKQSMRFVKECSEYIDDNTKLMCLYPDRYYSHSTIYDYIKSVSIQIGRSIYVHTPKMRNAVAGDWNYEADILNKLYDDGYVCGIKEEHSSLESAYNFIQSLTPSLHIIVAGGSMRRFNFLEPAGANSFLSGVGNIRPQLELKFLEEKEMKAKMKLISIEANMFKVFMKHGWHKSLRESLRLSKLTCFFDRQPWPVSSKQFSLEIDAALKELQNAI